jgi:hypothetical protein
MMPHEDQPMKKVEFSIYANLHIPTIALETSSKQSLPAFSLPDQSAIIVVVKQLMQPDLGW